MTGQNEEDMPEVGGLLEKEIEETKDYLPMNLKHFEALKRMREDSEEEFALNVFMDKGVPEKPKNASLAYALVKYESNPLALLNN